MKKVKDKAQVSLEMAMAVIISMILFLGGIRLFFWLNQRMVLRQEAYDLAPGYEQVDEASLPNLQLVGE